MIRQRALAWAAVLALVATVQSAPLPARFSASVAALAQDDSAADTGERTDLAIVALHCAEAPVAEALTSFLADATLPARCAPAVGVTLTVTENGDPVSGSPFTTDVISHTLFDDCCRTGFPARPARHTTSRRLLKTQPEWRMSDAG